MADQPGVPRHRRRRRGSPTVRLALAVAAWCLAAGVPGPAAAATVYADPAGVCAGLAPCFTTLQAAVDNAAPAPAMVGVFPGTYAESVDLDSMGSAVGGGPGDITLQALDAGGMPATSGVLVDPGAPGGPGAGPAIEAVSGMAFFPGAVALRGLALTSPDSVGFGCFCQGDIELQDVLLEGCGGSGAATITLGALQITDVVARLNGGDGGLFGGGSQVLLEDVVLDRNDGSGALLGAVGPLIVRRLQAMANGESGIEVQSCTSVEIEDVTADTNGGSGARALVDLDGCPAPASVGALLERRRAPRSWQDLESILPHSRDAPGATTKLGAVPILVTIDGLSANGNGALGAFVASDDAGVGISMVDLVATGNVDEGLAAIAEEVQLTAGTFTGNETGLLVFAVSALVSQVTASDNAPVSFTPPFDGAGVVIASASVSDLLDVEAERNAFAGVVLRSTAMLPVLGPYRITGGRFADNDLGIVSVEDGLVDVEILGAEVADNLVTGIALPNLRHGVVNGATATGNPAGITSRVDTALEVRESEISSNQEGISLVVQPGAQARVHCSNIRSNTPDAGLELADGLAVDARANFWGDPSGPTHPGNPGGLGDEVRDGANGGAGVVDYSLFLAAEATEADCLEPPVVEIPALGGLGLTLLVTLLLLAGLAALRGR